MIILLYIATHVEEKQLKREIIPALTNFLSDYNLQIDVKVLYIEILIMKALNNNFP